MDTDSCLDKDYVNICIHPTVQGCHFNPISMSHEAAFYIAPGTTLNITFCLPITPNFDLLLTFHNGGLKVWKKFQVFLLTRT